MASSLRPTQWTVRTEAMGAVIKQHSVITDTMEEVNQTAHDKYGSEGCWGPCCP